MLHYRASATPRRHERLRGQALDRFHAGIYPVALNFNWNLVAAHRHHPDVTILRRCVKQGLDELGENVQTLSTHELVGSEQHTLDNSASEDDHSDEKRQKERPKKNAGRLDPYSQSGLVAKVLFSVPHAAVDCFSSGTFTN